MKALLGLVTALSIPLLILNMLGGIVSGIWLGILGEWSAVCLGLFFYIVSTPVLSLALIPSMLFTVPGTFCAHRGKTFVFVCLLALGSLYVLTLVTIWCCGILFLFVKGATASSLIPRLIWSYGVATGPWAYMTSKYPQGEGLASIVATFFAALAYLVIMLLVLFTPITMPGAITVFGSFMLVSLLVHIRCGLILGKEMQAGLQQSDAMGQ